MMVCREDYDGNTYMVPERLVGAFDTIMFQIDSVQVGHVALYEDLMFELQESFGKFRRYIKRSEGGEERS